MATTPTTPTQLFVNRNGRIWTNYSLDLNAGNVFSIDNTPILSTTTLGVTVTTSNLRQVGTLSNLDVSGDTILGDFAYFNSDYGRLGLGTNEPSAAIDIIENNVEITIGSPVNGLGKIGTLSNHDLAITTDNVPRILIKNSGEINIGDPVNNNGILNVHGTINVTSLVTDVRIERSNNLIFQSAGTGDVYGVGLLWNTATGPKQFTLAANPNKFWSTESIDLADTKNYSINGNSVLSSSTLGNGVIYSNLITLGALQNLTVNGETSLLGNVDASNSLLSVKEILINNSGKSLGITNTSIKSSGDIALISQENVIIANANNGIQIGDPANIRKPVQIFGPLSINIQNPDPTLSFSVSGDVNVGGKRFTNGTGIPKSGDFTLGDICWNTNPQASSYIGWVCVSSGTPGQWAPFGLITHV